jgi:hypothetical protein
MICADCGHPIEYGQTSYVKYGQTSKNIGADRNYHSNCGDPLGLEAAYAAGFEDCKNGRTDKYAAILDRAKA